MALISALVLAVLLIADSPTAVGVVIPPMLLVLNAVLIGAVTALTETGPGDLSLDHALGIERRGPAWALASVAAGAATAALTMLAGSRGKPAISSSAQGGAAEAAHGNTTGDPTTAGA